MKNTLSLSVKLGEFKLSNNSRDLFRIFFVINLHSLLSNLDFNFLISGIKYLELGENFYICLE